MRNAVVLILTVSSLLLSGCGKGLSGQKVSRGEFEAYITKWSATSVSLGRPVGSMESQLEIRFGDTEDAKHYGLCVQNPFLMPYVLISEAKWKELDEDSRESLLFHELGHCILGREHLDTMNDETPARPVSLMNHLFLPGAIFAKHRAEYLKELFQ